MMFNFNKKWKNLKEVARKIEEEDRLDLETSAGFMEEDERKNLWERFPKRRFVTGYVTMVMGIGLACILMISLLMYVYLHVGDSYWKLSEEKRTNVTGTVYQEYANGMLRYSPDGISYFKENGDVMWSSNLSMQRPVVDVCGMTVVAADCRGTQISVFNEHGQMGRFQTNCPIEKVRVSNQGVVAAVLSDGDVTWVNLYDLQGNEIAKNRTSIEESGYPLDIDISPDGFKLMVSYLYFVQGKVCTKLCYYNFDSVGQTEVNNMVASYEYQNSISPEVFFAENDSSVAFQTEGFTIYRGKQIPELKKEVQFEKEILSTFHNDQYIGVLFDSEEEAHKYSMEIYDMNGKKIVDSFLDMDYKQIYLSKNNIIVFNDKTFEIYAATGKKKFSGDFEKPIENILSVGVFRKYMVLTKEKEYLIRLN